MHRLPLVSVFILIHISIGLTQADSILALPKDQQIKALWVCLYYGHEVANRQDTSRLKVIEEMEADFGEAGAVEMAQQAWLIRQVIQSLLIHVDSPKGNAIMERAMQTASDLKNEPLEAECMAYSGLVYYQQRQYGPAFDLLLRSYTRMKEIGFDRYPHLLRHVVNLAYAYYPFQDYEKAIGYLRETMALPTVWRADGFMRQTYNTLGLCYQQLMQYDSAIYYYTLARDASLMIQDTFWAALADGNRGKAYSLSGRYDEAMPLLRQDHRQSIRANEIGSAITSAMELAHIHLLRHHPDSATPYLEFAAQHILPKDYKSRSRYFELRSSLNKLQGDAVSALVQADSALLYRDSIMRFTDRYTKSRIKEQAEIALYMQNIRQLENQRDRQILMRNGMLVILLLTGSIIALWINRQKFKRRKEHELQMMQQQIATNKLKQAQTELEAFTETIRQKNELIESIQSELDLKRLPTQGLHAERAEQINSLLNATILTEDDWKEFRRRFDNVHPAFFGLIKERYPDLTPADLRLLALTKLRLAPREMMSMLGVSYDAIKKSRKRLITRLELSHEDNLVDFIQHLETEGNA